MHSYILGVLGIVLVSVLIEIILPSGQTAKYIKSIIAIFVVYILINPLVMFFKKDFDIKKYLNDNGVHINQTLLKNMYDEQILTRQSDLENLLSKDGYQGVNIVLEYEIVEDNILIKKVKVNLDKLVITKKDVNINKYQYIRQVILSQLALKESDVIFE